MVKISGTVYKVDTQDGLPGAVVKAAPAQGTAISTICDDQGCFQFENLPVGECKFTAMQLNYRTHQTKEFTLKKDRKDIRIQMTPVDPMEWNKEEYTNLYQAAQWLSSDIKKRVGLVFPVHVYVQDPLIAAQAVHEADPHISKRPEWTSIKQIFVPCEPDLMRGPTSSRIAVVDYDSDTNLIADPAEWDIDHKAFYIQRKKEKIWLSPEHCETPQFHQVNVWAIVQSILDMYEQTWILGRSAPWAFDGNRIILVPHAGETRNAYYDRNSKSIQFYYFHANGTRIDTCRSHDIIAHETGHAILDGLRPHYLEYSSLQTAAFHESIADLTAIMAALRNNDLRWEMAEESKGDLSKDKKISSLAEEFGYYSYGREYLRTAQDKRKIENVRDETSPYEWSVLLTSTMFEVMTQFMEIRKIKLMADGQPPSIKEALNLVMNRFRRVAFQPLDYLPPVDVQFSDYIQAVLRADEIVEPLDEDGYREAMKKVFTDRGFVWDQDLYPRRLDFYAHDIDRLSRSKTDAYHFLNENRRQLCIPMEQDISIADLYYTDKTVYGKGKLAREIVVQYVWREDVKLEGKGFGRLDGEYASLLCGGTLVFDSRGNVLSWQRKPGTGKMESGKHCREYCKKDEEKGHLRRRALLNYLQFLVEEGFIGVEQSPDTIGVQSPIVAGHNSDGTLRLQATSYLRHWAEK